MLAFSPALMRGFGLCRTAVAASLLAPGAAAQAMSSSRFVPPTARERARLAIAAREVLPNDVRRDPARHREKVVAWAGVTMGGGGAGKAVWVEHHYFDGVVEGNGGVWLSPWGEGRFCVLGVPEKLAARFDSATALFVRVYGRPVMTERGLCLEDALVVLGDRPWSTLVIEYGPGGRDDFSSADAQARGARHSHPEARGLTRYGYRALGGLHAGKTNLDDSPLGYGWSAAAELSLRASVRSELALMAGVESYPDFRAPTALPVSVLYRHQLVGIGVAAGPLLAVPLRGDEPVRFGLRYLPTLGDAMGAWAHSLAIGGGFDLTATADGDVRFQLSFVLGLDGNLGAPAR